MLPNEPGKQWNDTAISEEQVIRVAKAAAGLKRVVIGAKLGKWDDLRDGEGEGADDIKGSGGGERGLGAVIDDEAGGGGREVVEVVGERDPVGVDAAFGRDLL